MRRVPSWTTVTSMMFEIRGLLGSLSDGLFDEVRRAVDKDLHVKLGSALWFFNRDKLHNVSSALEFELSRCRRKEGRRDRELHYEQT